MSLIKCKECNNLVSDKADKCPTCGVKIPKKLTFIESIGIIIFGLIAIFFFSIDKKVETTVSNPVVSQEPDVQVGSVQKEPIITVSTPKKDDSGKTNEHPSAIPASKTEWDQTIGFISSVWGLVEKNTKQHDVLMKKQEKATRNKNMGYMLSAMVDYTLSLSDLQSAAKLIVPLSTSNADTNRFANNALSALNDFLILELSKNQQLNSGLTGIEEMPSYEQLEKDNRDINMQMLKVVHYLNKIYWNYGYESTQLDSHMRLKKNAHPSKMAVFNRE